jgi:hypothetical protein
VIAGGKGSLATSHPQKTVGSYWPYATTLWDYIRRAMPFDHPGTLTDDQLYAATAYVLYLNGMSATDVIDQASLPKSVRTGTGSLSIRDLYSEEAWCVLDHRLIQPASDVSFFPVGSRVAAATRKHCVRRFARYSASSARSINLDQSPESRRTPNCRHLASATADNDFRTSRVRRLATCWRRAACQGTRRGIVAATAKATSVLRNSRQHPDAAQQFVAAQMAQIVVDA